MILFHRTDQAAEILREGFRDGEGTYLTSHVYRGVWLSSDYPLDINEGAAGKDVLVIEIPEDVAEEWEWIQDSGHYREFLIPADILNDYGSPQLLAEVDVEDIEWWRRWLPHQIRLLAERRRHASS